MRFIIFAEQYRYMLKYKADLRALFYMLLVAVAFVWQWQQGFNIFVYIFYLFLAVAISVIAHNHNHINIWTFKPLNVVTDWFLTVFYGIPVFCWIPTHNRNHHRYNNREGDVTATYRNSENNNLFTLVSYPSASGYWQIKESIIPFMKQLRKTDRKTYYEYIVQIVVLASWIAFFLILDWKKAIAYVIIPQQVSGYIVMIFNYVQHVHADEESKWNHSRNFLDLNPLLFNNGYHTAHHEKANMHWSEAPKAHKAVAHLIDPKLIEKSFFFYMFRTYIMGGIRSRWQTQSMRLKRMTNKKAEPSKVPVEAQ